MPLDSLANAYLLSELICSTIDANDEVPATDLMLTEFDFFCSVRGSDKTRSCLSKKFRVVHQRTDADEIVLTFLAFHRGYSIFWHGGKGSG